MAFSKAQKRHAARAAKIDKLGTLARVLNQQAPGAGDALLDVLTDLHDTAAPAAPPKSATKAKLNK